MRSQSGGHLVAAGAQEVADLLHAGGVVQEGAFRAQGFLRCSWLDRIVVQAVGGLCQHPCCDGRTCGPSQIPLTHGGQVGYILDGPGVEPLFQGRSDAGDAAQGHQLDELGLPGLGDQQHAVGLGVGGGHLGYQLVGGDAHRAGHVELSGHAGSNPPGDGRGHAPAHERPGHVHIAFIY